MPNAMMLRTAATYSGLKRTVNCPSRTAFTAMAWMRPTSASNYLYGPVLSNDGGGSEQCYEIYYDYTSSKLVIWNTSDGYTGSASITINNWYHVTMIGSATELLGYLNGVLDVTAATYSMTPTTLFFGSDSWAEAGNAVCQGMLSCFKVWDRVLSVDEIKAEMYFAMPVSCVGLNSCYPMPNRQDLLSAGVPPMRANSDPLADWSGNGLNLTRFNDVVVGPGPRL